MLSFYDIFMYPLESMGIKKARKELIPRASKKVLEIGSGTGVNLRYYKFEEIDELTLSDYVIGKHLKGLHKDDKDKFHLVELDVQTLPFEDNSFDYVVHSLVFCTVPDVDKGISEIKRVLKGNGELIFIEHVLPEKKLLKKLFTFATPAWKKIGSGCHLNRDYISSLEKNNFNILFNKKFMNTAFIYGVAIPKAL